MGSYFYMRIDIRCRDLLIGRIGSLYDLEAPHSFWSRFDLVDVEVSVKIAIISDFWRLFRLEYLPNFESHLITL